MYTTRFTTSWLQRALLLAVASLALGLAACNSLFFYPSPRLVLTPEQLGLPYEDVVFQSSDQLKLHGWWLKAKGTPRGTVLFAHGNAQNVSNHIGAVYWLPPAGFNVFMFDYRGYGLSEGTPSIPGAIADFQAALDAVLARPEVAGQRVIVFGQSLGGAVSINGLARSAQRDRIAALIVESAFSDFREIARDKLDEFWLSTLFSSVLQHGFSADYSAAAVIGDLAPLPIVIIHGDADAIVPYTHALRLFDAAREPKQLWTVAGGGHISATLREEYKLRLLELMSRAMTAETPAPTP